MNRYTTLCRTSLFIAVFSLFPLLVMSQSQPRSACPESEQVATRAFARRFFSELKERDLESIDGEFLAQSASHGCHFPTPPVLVLEERVASRLDSRFLCRYLASSFEFLYLSQEYVLRSESIQIPTEHPNLLKWLPSEVTSVIGGTSRLRRFLMDTDSAGPAIASEEELRDVSRDLARISSALREFLRAHPPDHQVVSARLKRLKQDSAFSEAEYPIECHPADDEGFYGVPDGTAAAFVVEFPWYAIIIREGGQMRISRLAILSD